MRRKIFSLLVGLTIFGCGKNATDVQGLPVLNKDLNYYVPSSYVETLNKNVEAFSYGFENAPLILDANGESDFDYQKVEELTLKKMGIDLSYAQFTNPSSVISQEKQQEILNLMTPEILSYSNKILKVFSVFEQDIDLKEAENTIKKAVDNIESLEKEVLKDIFLEAWEKSTILITAVTAKSFISFLINLHKI